MAPTPAVAVTRIEGLAPPQAAIPHHDAAVDQEVVRDLLEVMGEEFADLVHIYLEDAPKNVALLEQAGARRDVAALIAPSHSLKSTSANLGAMALSEIAKRIEHGARIGTLNDPTELIHELAYEYGRVAAELRNLLAKSGA